MTIYWLGAFDGAKWRAEYQLYQQFKALNVQMRLVNCRSAAYEPYADWQARRIGVDVVFLQNGRGVRGDWLHVFEQIPLVYWATEASERSARHILRAERKPDLVIANTVQVFKEARRLGFPVVRMHNGYDPLLYHRTDIHEQFDVCLLGAMTRRRKEYLRYLQKGFGSTLRIRTARKYTAEQANSIYNASRVILHVHAINETYIPSRLFEGMPTRGCLLVESMGDNYDPALGRGYFMDFNGMNDMCSKVKELVRNTRARQRIVGVANKLAPKHTWGARAATLLTIMRKARQQWLTSNSMV